MTITQLSRRAFIRTSVGAAGGLMLGFHIPVAEAARTEARPWTTPTNGVEINAWLTIDPDGTVTIRVPHTEMGQGGMTSVALMIAEELDVEWTKVQAVFADANRHLRNNKEYKVMTTHGSQLVRLQHPHIMQAGASARERLKEAAARAWSVPRSEVVAKQGTLTAGGDLRRIRGGRREGAAGRGAGAQEPERLVAAWNRRPAAGHPTQDQWQRPVFDRHAPAQHGLRRGPRLSGALGHAQEL